MVYHNSLYLLVQMSISCGGESNKEVVCSMQSFNNTIYGRETFHHQCVILNIILVSIYSTKRREDNESHLGSSLKVAYLISAHNLYTFTRPRKIQEDRTCRTIPLYSIEGEHTSLYYRQIYFTTPLLISYSQKLLISEKNTLIIFISKNKTNGRLNAQSAWCGFILWA